MNINILVYTFINVRLKLQKSPVFPIFLYDEIWTIKAEELILVRCGHTGEC